MATITLPGAEVEISAKTKQLVLSMRDSRAVGASALIE